MRQDWATTSWVLCMIANANRNTKKRPDPYRPHEFDPTAENNKPAITKVSAAEMRQAFQGVRK